MLQLHNIHKSYGSSTVLAGLNLEITRGEIAALLGPNGAGKTTLVSVATGISPLDEGSIIVDGEDATNHRGRIGAAPQTLGVYPTLTVRKNLDLFGSLGGMRRATLRHAVNDIAEQLELTTLLDERVGLLSGGQQRRVHTAMALVSKPSVLFLDEPTVGADVTSRSQILSAVKQVATQGCAICYTTHYLPEIVELDATIAVLSEGTISARGTIRELRDSHGRNVEDIDQLYSTLLGADTFIGEFPHDS